ncbi:MAG: tetratricopeptide repeat protein [Acidobacteriota bacterium]|nr:tetratricopeptide repeat protein [Acidobacteriota bacterium]
MKIILAIVSCALLKLSAAVTSPPDQAVLYNEAGLQRCSEGRFAEAALEFAAEVKAWRALGDEYRPHLAMALSNLGFAQAAVSAFSESMAAHEEALTISSAAFPPQDLHRAEIMTDFARSLMAVEDNDRAEKLLEEALRIERSQAPTGPDAARTLRGMAMLAVRRGETRNAETLLEQAGRLPDTDGEGEIEAAAVRISLVRLYATEGKFDRAEPLLRRVAAVYGRSFSARDPRLILITAQQGMLYLDERKFALGENCLRDALARLKGIGAENTMDAANVENSLALVELDLGRTQEADVLLQHVLSVERAHYPAPTRNIAATLLNLGLSMGKQHRYPEAIQYAKESVDMYQTTVGSQHPETANALLVYSDLLKAGGADKGEVKLAKNRAEAIFKVFGNQDGRRK